MGSYSLKETGGEIVNEPRAHIERIRKDFQASKRVKDSLNNSIQALAHDLYSKETHFIFELIQNAEDNTYKETEPSLCFRLVKTDPTNTQNAVGALIIQNNETGFTPDNVDAICAVGKTTKSKIRGYIGEKGIGFKSVFRITTIPHIFSNGYQFCFPEKDEETGLGYIVPRWVNSNLPAIGPTQTTIVLPLDKPDFGYEIIEEMLRDIEPETILFLSKLKEIQIITESGDDLSILKDDTKNPKIQLLIEGQKQGKSYSEVDEFLMYTKSVDKPANINHEKRIDIDKRDVSIVFAIGENKESVGKIFAYLPVRSDTGLPFLINADFILPSSREEIRGKVPWNQWLMGCVANLLSEALPRLKEKGLLTIDLLEALAKRMNELDESSMFYPIVGAVHDAFLDQELLPADDGSFVAAQNANLARGRELRKLLNQDQLRSLFQVSGKIKWLAGTITIDRTPDLRAYLVNVLDVEEITPDVFARKIAKPFLQEQSDDWIVSMYGFVGIQKALWKPGSGLCNPAGPLRSKPIVRLQNGSHVNPFRSDGSPSAYLTDGIQSETSLPIVKIELSQHKEVYQFLNELGIPELDLVAEVIEKLLPKYTNESRSVSIVEHKRDVIEIERAYATDSQEKKRRLRERLRATPFILMESQSSGGAYRRPRDLYFGSDELRLYFSGNNSFGCVSPDYPQSAMALFDDLGVEDSVRVQCKAGNRQGFVDIKNYHGWHERGINGFDPEIHVDGLEYAIAAPTPEKSEFIWNNIAIPHSACIRGVVEKSTRQTYENSTKEDQISDFGRLLIEAAWLPGSDGSLHEPMDLTLDDLPDSFIRDEKLAQQLGMKMDVVAKLAEKAGVTAEDIELLRQHPEEFDQWKAAISAKKQKPAFPERASSNPERRREKLAEQMGDAPKKKYEQRDRSVRTTRGAVDPVLWLKNQYKNEADQMICQVCKEEMPFRKRDGEYYFEAVEAFSGDHFTMEHEAQFIAMCPLCAAMYKEFVKQDEAAMVGLKNELMNTDDCEVPLCLGELDTTIRFVETHYQDIKAILEDES